MCVFQSLAVSVSLRTVLVSRLHNDLHNGSVIHLYRNLLGLRPTTFWLPVALYSGMTTVGRLLLFSAIGLCIVVYNQTVNDGVAHSKNTRKCVYHVIFDLDLDLEHTLDAGSPGDHPVQVWWRSGHLSARRSDLRKSLQTDGQTTDAAPLHKLILGMS